jgi:hypothetical protein
MTHKLTPNWQSFSQSTRASFWRGMLNLCECLGIDPHQQAEDMTALTTKRNAAKKPLISGRRPDMTMPSIPVNLTELSLNPNSKVH